MTYIMLIYANHYCTIFKMHFYALIVYLLFIAFIRLWKQLSILTDSYKALMKRIASSRCWLTETDVWGYNEVLQQSIVKILSNSIWNTPNMAYFGCLSYLTHPIEVMEHSTIWLMRTRWVRLGRCPKYHLCLEATLMPSQSVTFVRSFIRSFLRHHYIVI